MVSWARFSGSAACSSLEIISHITIFGYNHAYTAAAALDCDRRGCHRRSNGHWCVCEERRMAVDACRFGIGDMQGRLHACLLKARINCRWALCPPRDSMLNLIARRKFTLSKVWLDFPDFFSLTMNPVVETSGALYPAPRVTIPSWGLDSDFSRTCSECPSQRISSWKDLI